MARTLSNPTVEVNDDPIRIVPNSLVYKTGQGDKAVKAQSGGGNDIETVVTENAETKVSMVKFKLFNTEQNLAIVKIWMAGFSNTIELSEGSTAESFRGMVVTTEPERNIGADGDLEITFEGQPSL